uniref:Uncharacterized protein n=1 Tax=Marseillevirus LCMAC103 TaxID=2506604 RepID=A0A481YV86_9VIRU|nr:MAG: hypothetical protein LCMAC103_04160 [Marseillevirus LCMAC103]
MSTSIHFFAKKAHSSEIRFAIANGSTTFALSLEQIEGKLYLADDEETADILCFFESIVGNTEYRYSGRTLVLDYGDNMLTVSVDAGVRESCRSVGRAALSFQFDDTLRNQITTFLARVKCLARLDELSENAPRYRNP